MGLELFRIHILTPAKVEKRLIDGLLMLIERERKMETVDRGLLKNLLRMLSDLQVSFGMSPTYPTSALPMHCCYRKQRSRVSVCLSQIYDRVFERRFLTATDELYRQEGQRLSLELEVPQYLSHVSQRLAEELARLTHYLDCSTK